MAPRHNDTDYFEDDGTYDSTFTVVAMGAIAPVVMMLLAGWAVWSGGVTLSSKGTVWRYDGANAVGSAVCFCLGVALLLVSKFLLPNVFRRNYHYQYFAIAGAMMAAVGAAWFVIAALV